MAGNNIQIMKSLNKNWHDPDCDEIWVSLISENKQKYLDLKNL